MAGNRTTTTHFCLTEPQIIEPMPTTINPTMILDDQDLESIRKFLPYDWRQQILAAHPNLNARLITECFALRTRNAVAAETVFTIVARILQELGQDQLATKCHHRIQYCKAVQHVTA
jgi:hypothetical protein